MNGIFKSSTPLTEIKKNILGNLYVNEEKLSFRIMDDLEISINPALKVIDVFPKCKPNETLKLLLMPNEKKQFIT